MHSKKVVIFRASPAEEKRVAITPEVAKKLNNMGWSVWVQSGAGAEAGFPDQAYVDAHANVSHDVKILAQDAQLALCLAPPTPEHASFLPKTCALLGLLGSDMAPAYLRDHPAYTLERLPRTTGAQTMDVLSSQSSLYGYWAVLDGARRLSRIMPMMTTPSGRLNPAQVLVLGAGVAGLQAIATAKRLGAVVSAFDVRESARGGVESLDCKFYRVSEKDKTNGFSDAKAGETEGGYALRVGSEMLLAQQALIATLLPKMNLIIATAMIPGQEPPILITQGMVQKMHLGSVIVDLTTDRLGAPLGSSGNCAISRRGEDQKLYGVTIVGTSYGLSHLSHDASTMYANNLLAFLDYAWDDQIGRLNDALELVRPLKLQLEA
jgi:NAD(P) transhydrogenase subunit alpha